MNIVKIAAKKTIGNILWNCFGSIRNIKYAFLEMFHRQFMAANHKHTLVKPREVL